MGRLLRHHCPEGLGDRHELWGASVEKDVTRSRQSDELPRFALCHLVEELAAEALHLARGYLHLQRLGKASLRAIRDGQIDDDARTFLRVALVVA